MALEHRDVIYTFKTLMLGEHCMAFRTQSQMLIFGEHHSGLRATTYCENTHIKVIYCTQNTTSLLVEHHMALRT